MDENSSPHRGAASCQHGNTSTYIFAPVPSEILEKMIEHLDLSSILNLRLTCRDLAKRAVGPHLLKNAGPKLTRPTFDLSSARFSRVEEIVSSPDFGPAVKHLTVQGVVYYTDSRDKLQVHSASESKKMEAQERLSWLANRRSEQALAEWDGHQEVMTRLAEMMKLLGGARAESPTLPAGLELDCVVSPGERLLYSPVRSGSAIWNLVALRASQAFYVTMHAMVRSGLETPSLSVFSQTRRCSVPAGAISWLLRSVDNQDLARAMSGIKNFALSFAPTVGRRAEFGLQPAEAGASEESEPGSQRESDVIGLSPGPDELSLLQQEAFIDAPRFVAMVSAEVEVLDLHMYNPYNPRRPGYCQIFTNLARDTHFAKLRDCTLRGLWATADSIVQFLDKHGSQLERLTLRDIWLPNDDSWLPVFGKLQPDTLPKLGYLMLENLFAVLHGGKGLVNLAPKEGMFQRTGVDRNGDEVYFDITSFPKSRHHFPCRGGRVIFAREWDGEAFFMESRDEQGVPVGLEFVDERPGVQVSPSYMHVEWILARAEEFGPPVEEKDWDWMDVCRVSSNY